MPANLTLYTRALDFGLNALDTECDAIHICVAGSITNYASVLSLSRGSKTFTRGQAFGSPGDGSGGGRIVASATITGGTVSADGDVTQWVAVDSTTTTVLASGSLSGTVSVATGQSFSLGSWNVHLFGTAAPTYTGLGDIAGVGTPLVWYGMRAFSAAKIGSNIVRLKHNDTVEIDYAAQSDGGLALSTISADILTHGSPTIISRFYNQGSLASAGKDMTINWGTPLYIASGLNSKPVVRLDAASGMSSEGNVMGGSDTSQPYCFYMVAKHISGANAGVISVGTAGNRSCNFYMINNAWWGIDAGQGGSNEKPASDGHWHTDLARASGTTSIQCIDGTNASQANAGTNSLNHNYPFNLGFDPWGNCIGADVVEFGIWPSDQLSHGSEIHSNVVAYYGTLP